MTGETILPVVGMVFAAIASLIGVLATSRASNAANARTTAIEEFRTQVTVRDTWITEMDRRVNRLERNLAAERAYVDRLRDWIAEFALPALVQSGMTYPPVPEYKEVSDTEVT